MGRRIRPGRLPRPRRVVSLNRSTADGCITGTFVADFKSFYDAVQQSTVKLKDFQSNAETVARSVDKVANAFSGRKLVQDAEIMTKAITEIGGATALTAKEQAQVNAKLAEAIEKYKALGQVAPKEMQDLEKATRGGQHRNRENDDRPEDIGGGLLKMASRDRDCLLGRCRGRGLSGKACSKPPARSRTLREDWASPPKRCSDSAMPPNRREGRSTTSAPRSSR